MTNADKYLKDGVDISQLAREITELAFANDKCLEDTIVLYFREQVKPTLTEDEKVILRNIGKEIKYITRDKSGYLYITEQSFSVLSLPFSIYNHLFQFIKPRRRIFY